MTTVQITISDALAKEAAAEGLLETGSIEAILRERLAGCAAFSEDRLANRAGREPAFRSLINHKENFDHGSDRWERFGAAAPRRHTSQTAPKNRGDRT